MIISTAAVLSTEDANAPVFGYHNLVTVSNIFVTGQDANYPIFNIANPNTNLWWKAASGAAHGIVIDVTSYGADVDYIGIAKHNFGSASIPVAITVKNLDNSYTIVEPYFVPVDDTPLIVKWTPRTVKEVLISTDVSGTGAPARIGVVYVGKLLVSERRVYVGHTPITMGRATKVANGRSENGNFLGRIITQESVSGDIKLQNLHAGWYREKFEPFRKVAAGQPFFFAWRPQTYPAEVGFVWLTDDVRPMNSRSNGMMDVDLSFAGIVA